MDVESYATVETFSVDKSCAVHTRKRMRIRVFVCVVCVCGLCAWTVFY